MNYQLLNLSPDFAFVAFLAYIKSSISVEQFFVLRIGIITYEYGEFKLQPDNDERVLASILRTISFKRQSSRLRFVRNAHKE